MASVFIFRAALLCEECGLQARATLDPHRAPHIDPTDELSFDSDEYPKGPFPDGGEEADCPQHCDHCGDFLYNPLTADGVQYVREAVAADPAGTNPWANEWKAYYAGTYDLEDAS